ncbi:hypothetical protein [Streptomyces werraensis]|uniref:hypothetical protein n=1 Tax=Streptomyces werraensis TaxID=68284 RepID=UPI0037D89142
MFEPVDPARTGRVAFWDPAGGTPPASPGGEPGEADLVVPDEDGFTVRTVPVLRLTPARALPVFLHARRTTTTAPATAAPPASAAPATTAAAAPATATTSAPTWPPAPATTATATATATTEPSAPTAPLTASTSAIRHHRPRIHPRRDPRRPDRPGGRRRTALKRYGGCRSGALTSPYNLPGSWLILVCDRPAARARHAPLRP